MVSLLRTAGPLPSDRRRRGWSRVSLHGAVARALTVTLGTACSDDDDGTTTPTPAGTYTLSVAPTIGVTGFVPTTVPVTITRANGFAGPVTLGTAGLLPFLNASFNPAVIPAGAITSRLTITLLRVEPQFAGTIPLTVVGQAAGVTAQSSAPLQIALDWGPLTLAAAPGGSRSQRARAARQPSRSPDRPGRRRRGSSWRCSPGRMA